MAGAGIPGCGAENAPNLENGLSHCLGFIPIHPRLRESVRQNDVSQVGCFLGDNLPQVLVKEFPGELRENLPLLRLLPGAERKAYYYPFAAGRLDCRPAAV